MSDDKREKRRAAQRKWARDNYKRQYERHKEKMASDPEYAARYRERMQKKSRVRRAETPAQRERRLQRDRENKARKYREMRAARPLVPRETPKPKVREPKAVYQKPRVGRILALSRWYKW